MFDATLARQFDDGGFSSNLDSIVWDSTTGILTLNGTAGDDIASVNQANVGSQWFTATLNNKVETIVLGKQDRVSEIIFNGYTGDDSFTNNTLYDSQANGGAGEH